MAGWEGGTKEGVLTIEWKIKRMCKENGKVKGKDDRGKQFTI
jgi:hypothetical protein